MILGIPWLATVDAFISCRLDSMTISQENESKQISLYPPARSITELEHTSWFKETNYDEEIVQSLFSISQAINEDNDEDLLDHFLSNSSFEEQVEQIHLDPLLAQDFQENCTTSSLQYLFQTVFPVNSISNSHIKSIEIFLGIFLNINANLEESQEQQLIELLRKYSKVFAWENTDMVGIHLETCTHHIYIEENVRPIRQPQSRMNPMLKEIVNIELEKLLKVGFIYPISDSRWVSPLVVVPKKNGKWRVCVDYREINKETLKDYFPLPFIDQELDTLAGNIFFSFLDEYSGYNQIKIALEDRDKTTFTCPWGTHAYKVLPFGLCNAPATFQRAVLAILVDLIHECVELYMDGFSLYGNSFEEALVSLEKVLIR